MPQDERDAIVGLKVWIACPLMCWCPLLRLGPCPDPPLVHKVHVLKTIQKSSEGSLCMTLPPHPKEGERLLPQAGRVQVFLVWPQVLRRGARRLPGGPPRLQPGRGCRAAGPLPRVARPLLRPADGREPALRLPDGRQRRAQRRGCRGGRVLRVGVGGIPRTGGPLLGLRGVARFAWGDKGLLMGHGVNDGFARLDKHTDAQTVVCIDNGSSWRRRRPSIPAAHPICPRRPPCCASAAGPPRSCCARARAAPPACRSAAAASARLAAPSFRVRGLCARTPSPRFRVGRPRASQRPLRSSACPSRAAGPLMPVRHRRCLGRRLRQDGPGPGRPLRDRGRASSGPPGRRLLPRQSV